MGLYLGILLPLLILGYVAFTLFSSISFHAIPDSVWASATLGVSGGLVYVCKEIPMRIYSWCSTRFAFKIDALSNSEILYKTLNAWVSTIQNPIIKNNVKMDLYDDTEASESIGYGTYTFLIDTLTLACINKSIHDKGQNSFDSLTVQIFGLHRNRYIESINAAFEKVVIKDALKVRTTRWGPPALIDQKSLEYIFSPQKDKIVKCVDKWLESEKIFKTSGVIYKLGILMYGKPGTGKSSFARALATYLGWGIVSVNLSELSSQSLINWMGNVGKNKIIMLEDIDVCTSSRGEDEDSNETDTTTMYLPNSQPVQVATGRISEESVSLDTLLNVLDGIYSPSNVIFIATTNFIDRLDTAFKRPGRFDCKFEMEELDESLAVQMCNQFGADTSILKEEKFPINQAYLQGKIFDNITDFRSV